jgi:tetratricopeptide (TPR) repeat protein
LTDHLTLADINGVLFGGLDEKQLRAALAHLLHGCDQCLAEVLLLLDASSLAEDAPKELPVDLDTAYDLAIDRAFAVALNAEKRLASEALAMLERRGPLGLALGPARLRGVPALEALLRKSWDLRHEDPSRSVELAKWATIIAGQLSSELLGTENVADFRCRAWAALGNAYRVADNYAAAESAITEAFNHFTRGSRDEILLARLIDFQASLWADQSRFKLAIESLDVAHAIYRAHGEEHLAARLLVSKGLFTGYANDADGAVQILSEALKKIDPATDSDLALRASHNLALFMVESGRFREARALVIRNQWRLQDHQDHRIDLLKLRWVEARANAGLGLPERAERGFVEVREGMLDVGKRYHSALAALDLSLIYLRQNRLEDTRSTVLEAAEVFLDLEISREAIGAVLVLQNAYRKGLEASALLEKAVDFLRRLERDSALTFKAWFL